MSRTEARMAEDVAEVDQRLAENLVVNVLLWQPRNVAYPEVLAMKICFQFLIKAACGPELRRSSIACF